MKTMSSLKGLFVLLVSSLLLTACQSEQETSAGFSFPKECATCHGDSPEFPILGAATGYEHSGHKNGYDMEEAHAYYSNGGGCQNCHTHEGFLEYLKTGDSGRDTFVAYPSQPGCFTCHAPHQTGDMELRTSDAVKLANGVTFDKGDGNLCANCHKSRSDVNEAVKEDKLAKDVSIRLGPHYGPQSDIFWGTNAYEYAGKSYSSSEHKLEIENACVSCHMFLPPDGRFSSNASIGGHSFAMAGELHGAESLNIKACLTCHEDLKQVDTDYGPMFSYKADADYDQDGEIEIAQLEVAGLLEHLVNAKGTGLMQQGKNPLFDAEGNQIRVKDESLMRSVTEQAAIFNYRTFTKGDRSYGIHNYPYTVQVLTDTIESLDSSFDTSNRPE